MKMNADTTTTRVQRPGFHTHFPRVLKVTALMSAVFVTSGWAQTANLAPAASSEPRFTVNRFEVSGVTLVNRSVIQKALAPLTGPDKRFGDIEKALEAVRAVYEKAGVTAMQVLIPEQTLKDGLVKLQVEEFKLQRVEILGARFRNKDNIRRAVPPLHEGTTPNDLVISEALRLANENPGRQMEVTFRSDDDGELVGVIRAADRDAVAGQVSLDNTGSASTGKYRLGVAMQHHNLFNRDVVGTVQLQTSPGFWKEVQILSSSARIPVYQAGWMVEASVVKSSVDSGTVQNVGGPTLFINSEGVNAGLKLTNLLPRWGGWDQRWSVGWDFKHIDSQVTTTPGGASLVPDIVLRPMTLSYNGLLRDDKLTVFALASHSRNLPGRGRSSKGVFAEPGVRLGSNPDYRITRLNLSAGWPVWGGQASAAFSGQWSPDALVSAEQFGVGGDGSIRGFNGRVASNDEGERIGLEWQSAIRPFGSTPAARPGTAAGGPGEASASPSLASQIAWGWQTYLEAGQVRRNRPQANEVTRSRLAGAGLGLRLIFRDQLSVRADLGVVLRGETFANRGDYVLHVAANYGF